jgi:hypothetical protein
MRWLLKLIFVAGLLGGLYHYFDPLISFRGADLNPNQIKLAYEVCAQESGLPVKNNNFPFEVVPIEELSTKDRNLLLGCALESGSYNFVHWVLQNPKETLSIEVKYNNHWPVESVARWSNGPAAVNTMELILEQSNTLSKDKSASALIVALYEAATVEAAEYLSKKFGYLLPEDNQKFFDPDDYRKYFGLTLAQFHAFSGRIEVAEYFASMGSRVAIPDKSFRQWILAHDKKIHLDDKLDAFLIRHGVPRVKFDDIVVASSQSGLNFSASSSLKLPSTSGYPLMLGDSGRALWVEGTNVQRWDPSSNELKDQFELPFPPESAFNTELGIFFAAEGYVGIATPGGKLYSTHLTLKRSKQNVVVLSDQSVLVIGGTVNVETNGNKGRSSAVERIVYRPGISFGYPLSVERMPDLPGTLRTSFSVVALKDGRAMLLGGTDSPYVGCSPCTSETWFFDPKSKAWSSGPKMNEARSDFSATLLPDGGVLVAGGWTPEHGWGGAGSRTVERWDPKRNAFVPLTARMTSYMSMHRALWLPGLEGKQLLFAGGNSAAIQVYDTEHDIWRVAGENCQGTENSKLRTVIPFLKDSKYSVIVQNADWCPGQSDSWGLVPLRLPLDAANIKSTARTFSGDSGITLYRGNMAFLPGQNDGPSLALGGTIHAGMNNYVITSAADVIWPDGHIQSLPGFVHARSAANIFRLTDGSLLLTGGQTDVGGYDHAKEKATSAEWLPNISAMDQRHWQPVEFTWAHEVLGQMVDGSMIALNIDGNVDLIKISADTQSKPHEERTKLPPLSQPRMIQEQTSLVVRGLPDGRIIVAGGATQNKRLAIMREDSMEINSIDEYLRIGEAKPTNTYEVYEPNSGQWRLSVASSSYGGLLAVYDDGRVARLYNNVNVGNDKVTQTNDLAMEISSADGGSWSKLKAEELPNIGVKYNTRMFVLQNELFISGGKLHTDIATLQWFNETTRRWVTLWQGMPELNWRNDVGRIIIRELSNGKRVTLPVAGL